MKLFREPLFHFLLIGGAIFVLFIWINGAPVSKAENVIDISDQRVARLKSGFEATWRRLPNDAELDRIIEDQIREEVLVREAKALGLDVGDVIIRRRLRQKMEFLLGSASASRDPSEAELLTYYDANRKFYQIAPKIAFEQVFAGETASMEDVESLKSALTSGRDPDQVGKQTLLPTTFPLSSSNSIDGRFGQGFFDALSELEIGQWLGPIPSGYGKHLVKILERVDPQTPELNTIRDTVIRDWKHEKAVELSEQQYQSLASRYEIQQPQMPD